MAKGSDPMLKTAPKSKRGGATAHYQHNVTPEQGMFCAVIERAILDATNPANGKDTHRAREWIFDWNENSDPTPTETTVTFGWICDVVGLDWRVIQDVVLKAIEANQTFTPCRHLSMMRCIIPLDDQ